MRHGARLTRSAINMGALIFYTAIYFIGYYLGHLINGAAGRILIGNRRMAGLVLALMVGFIHGYKIISSPPPHDHGGESGYAPGLYVILPLAIITLAVLYFTWVDRQDKQDGQDGDAP